VTSPFLFAGRRLTAILEMPSVTTLSAIQFCDSGVENRRHAINETGGQWLRPSEIGAEGTGCNRPLEQADTCSEPYLSGSKPVISHSRSSVRPVTILNAPCQGLALANRPMGSHWSERGQRSTNLPWALSS